MQRHSRKEASSHLVLDKDALYEDLTEGWFSLFRNHFGLYSALMGFSGCHGPALSAEGSNHQKAGQARSGSSSLHAITMLVSQDYEVRLLDP